MLVIRLKKWNVKTRESVRYVCQQAAIKKTMTASSHDFCGVLYTAAAYCPCSS